VDVIERQTGINIEPLITITTENWINIIDGKIRFDVRNDGVVTVIKVSLIPYFYVCDFRSPEGQRWRISFASHKQVESEVLGPGDVMPVEFGIDTEQITKLKQKTSSKSDFAFDLVYRREADHRSYEIHRRYIFHEEAHAFIRIPQYSGRTENKRNLVLPSD
jgi:hypothetical protein